MTAPAQPTSPWNAVLLDVARTVIDGARTTNHYPPVVDGAEPEVVMAMAAAVVRRAAMDSDCGAEWLLTEARDGLVHGVGEGTATKAEASVGLALLELADPRRTVEEIYDRAVAWSLTRGWLDTLDVIGSGVDMLRFIASMTGDPDAFLDGLAAQLAAAGGAAASKNATTEGENE